MDDMEKKESVESEVSEKATEVVAEDQEFAESKNGSGSEGGFSGAPAGNAQASGAADGFMNIPDGIDEELPFT